jgi:hypothetical protein
MNIFVLNLNPSIAAQDQCDKHVVKMVLETAQLLCSAYPDGVAPYKRTHYNHPCSIWTRECYENWTWLLDHGNALSREYSYRYGKRHKTQDVFDWMRFNQPALTLLGDMTPFAQAMPPVFKNEDAVVAYRAYYVGAKQHIARWNKGRDKPDWYN